MRHRFFRVVGVGLVGTICLTVAGSANAAFIGVDFVFDAARTAAAQTTAAAGNDVFLLYAAFTDPNDLFLNIFNVNFDAGATLYQHASGSDLAPNDTFFGLASALEYDSFVTVGGLTTTQVGNGVGVDGSGINFTATGMTGNSGWFSVPTTGLGNPQFNADISAVMGSNVYTVVLAQLTVAQGPRAVFSGGYSIGWSNASGLQTFTGSWPHYWPTPGAMALFGLAGLAATRRRRA